MTKWRKWFAWYPVRTTSGQVAWLQKLERRWDSENSIWIDPYSGFGFLEGAFEYRLPALGHNK